MKYFDKYKYLIIGFNSIEESKKLQEFLFKQDILWGGDSSKIYDDNNGYYVVGRHDDNEFISLGYLTNINDDWPQGEHVKKSNNKIYTMDTFDIFKTIIIFGSELPSYKPKKIIREI